LTDASTICNLITVVVTKAKSAPGSDSKVSLSVWGTCVIACGGPDSDVKEHMK
jgi:hypothetical protein